MENLVERLRPGGRVDEWQGRPPRAVFLDVDGTSLGTTAEPTPAFVEACRAVQAAGVRLGFATGRPPAGVEGLRRILGTQGPYIVHNGAQVLFNDAPSRRWPLSAEALHTIERWCLARGVYAEFAVGTGFVVTDFCEAARPSWDEISGDPAGLTSDVDLVAARSCKITVTLFEPTLLPELTALCSALDVHLDPSTAPIFPGAVILNITAAGVNKGSAVEWAARRIGLTAADVMVVGDSDNDLSMLRVAGTAVAMGQAPAHVQAAAHLVTGTFEDEGCAAALHSCLVP